MLGKTNLSEWANFRSTHSIERLERARRADRNPYALDRNPSGSSSGIRRRGRGEPCAPSASAPRPTARSSRRRNVNGLVGIKPTLGLVSRTGIVPIAHSQDTAGPMARTVADAAALLGALAGVDPARRQRPHATAHATGATTRRRSIANGLQRRAHRRRRATGCSAPTRQPTARRTTRSPTMKQHGAVIVDPANIPTLGKFDDSEFEVLLYEFKADLNEYLTWLGAAAPVHSLDDIIAFNNAHAAEELPLLRPGDHADRRRQKGR